MKTFEEYLRLDYPIEIVPDAFADGTVCYMARCPALPGCMSHGDSPEEARLNLEDAKRLYIGALLKKGVEPQVPEPKPFHAVWAIVGVSGTNFAQEEGSAKSGIIEPVMAGTTLSRLA